MKHAKGSDTRIGYVQMSLAAYLAGQGFTADQANRGWELLKAEPEPAQTIEEFVIHLHRIADQLRSSGAA